MKISRFDKNKTCKENQIMYLIVGILLIGLSFNMQYLSIHVSEFFKHVPSDELDSTKELERSIKAERSRLSSNAILIIGVILVSSVASIWMSNCPNKKCDCDEKKK